MKAQLHPINGKKKCCSCSCVCTCLDVVQHESLLAVLVPGLEDLKQTVVRVAVSIDCQEGTQWQNAQASEIKKPRQSLYYYKGRWSLQEASLLLIAACRNGSH